MNKDIQNYAPTVMFPGTPCISQQKKSMEESITSLSSYWNLDSLSTFFVDLLLNNKLVNSRIYFTMFVLVIK